VIGPAFWIVTALVFAACGGGMSPEPGPDAMAEPDATTDSTGPDSPVPLCSSIPGCEEPPDDQCVTTGTQRLCVCTLPTLPAPITCVDDD
jgi:hypothetical protein